MVESHTHKSFVGRAKKQNAGQTDLSFFGLSLVTVNSNASQAVQLTKAYNKCKYQ